MNKSNSIDIGIVSLMTEIQKTIKNRDTQDIDDIKSIISSEQKSVEARFFDLFNLKADRKELTSFNEFFKNNYMTMEKGKK
jgi:hypothetical protein